MAATRSIRSRTRRIGALDRIRGAARSTRRGRPQRPFACSSCTSNDATCAATDNVLGCQSSTPLRGLDRRTSSRGCGGREPRGRHDRGRGIGAAANGVVGSVRAIFDPQGAVVGRMDYGRFREKLRADIKFPTVLFAQLAGVRRVGTIARKHRNYSTGPQSAIGNQRSISNRTSRITNQSQSAIPIWQSPLRRSTFHSPRSAIEVTFRSAR